MSKVVQDAAALAAAGASALRKVGSAVLHPGGGGDEDATRWLAVTVNRAPGDVAPGGTLPAPLADLGDRIETAVRPAPGDKGTELAARLRDPAPAHGAAGASGDDPRDELRSALRRAKQLLEVGEVLSVDGQPAGERSPTPTGKLVETVAERADKEGLV